MQTKYNQIRNRVNAVNRSEKMHTGVKVHRRVLQKLDPAVRADSLRRKVLHRVREQWVNGVLYISAYCSLPWSCRRSASGECQMELSSLSFKTTSIERSNAVEVLRCAVDIQRVCLAVHLGLEGGDAVAGKVDSSRVVLL